MKKRILVLCLSLAMAASMTACGSSENSSKSSQKSKDSSISQSEESSKEESIAASSAAETESVTTTKPADSSEPESTVDKDAVIIDTDNFEIDKPYYAYSEEANMWLQIRYATETAAYVVIVDNNNVNHSIEGFLMNLKKDGYYTEGNDEIGIVWKYIFVLYRFGHVNCHVPVLATYYDIVVSSFIRQRDAIEFPIII